MATKSLDTMKPGGAVRIASWNINSVRARLHLVEQLMAEESPDILCFQETKVEDGTFFMNSASNPIDQADLTLDGGTFTVQGSPSVGLGKLDAFAYTVSGNNGDNRLDQIGNQGAQSILLASPL